MATTFDKKKKREKASKKKVMDRRKAHRAKLKEDDQKERERLASQRVSNKLQNRTIRHTPRDEEKTMSQLEHNLAILEALKKEQEDLAKAQADQPIVNTTGLPQETPKSFGASADVVFTPKVIEGE